MLQLRLDGRYPTTVWSKGEQVFERRQLRVPANAAGVADVLLRLGDKELDLGKVEIAAGEHNFNQPLVDTPLDAQFDEVARLVGFDLSQDIIKSDEIVTITLYWQALATGTESNYVVFAHLLDEEGRLVGQHDSSPANSSRPTTGWLADEFVVDRHDMSLRDKDYRGQAFIEIGLYDPTTGTRLQLANGSDQLVLPIALSIE